LAAHEPAPVLQVMVSVRLLHGVSRLHAAACERLADRRDGRVRFVRLAQARRDILDRLVVVHSVSSSCASLPASWPTGWLTGTVCCSTVSSVALFAISKPTLLLPHDCAQSPNCS